MIEKLDMKSMDITEENVKKIQALFPSAVTEVIVDGKTTLKIDFDVLKQELSANLIEDKQERYQMTWPDKSKAKVLANSRITSTLRPDKEKSVDFDNTQNLYIEGDNLDVLKLLRETYLGKVKMIYIDPPYNTGNDFVYNDDFSQSADEYMETSGQYDEEGNRLVKNLESSGRIHTDWLNMIYPRLKVAKDLLSEDGFIFISIDDHELFNLKRICDEIFGEDNFINNISIKMSELSGVKMKHLSKYAKLKETGLLYAKNASSLILNIEKKNKSKETLDGYMKYYSSIIENIEMSCEEWIITSLKDYFTKKNIVLTEEQLFDWKINNADRLVYRTNSRTVEAFLKNNPTSPSIMKIINNDGNEIIKWEDKEMLFLSKYIKEYIGDIWMDISTINLNKETESITFENGQKPLALLKRVIKTCVHNDAIILDFFSGSATTAHAVILQNAEDGGNRKFIMVQLPEECDEKSEAYKAGYKTICEIGEERIRRAGTKIKETLWKDNPSLIEDKISFSKRNELDTGFRVLKLDSSNMQDVYYNPQAIMQSLLDETIDNVKTDRTPLDLLFQVMLDLGVELSAKIEEKQVNGKTYFVVNGNDLIACFDEDIDNDVITEIAKQQPLYAVFKSTSFATDSASINNEQLFKTYSPATVIKVI